MSLFSRNEEIHIRDVWNYNLEEEFALINRIVDDFPYVAMDTEFPGFVIRFNPNHKKKTNDENYNNVKQNVNVLKLIQLGLTFFDKNGNLPKCEEDNKYCVWQFNFREFNVNTDMHAKDSIALLRSCGINFRKTLKDGVEGKRFVEKIMTSGAIMNDDVYWVHYHGGHDFGYLIRLLMGRSLPERQSEFFELIKAYFPEIYDVKYMERFCNGLYGGLDKLAGLLGVERVGVAHQAGSDSLLTACIFRRIKETYFPGSLDRFSGIFHGLGVEN